MTDATLQIQEAYKALQNAAIALQKELNNLPENDWKKTLGNEMAKHLSEPYTTLEKLKVKLKQIDTYLQMHLLLMKANPPKDENLRNAIRYATQGLIAQRNNLAKLFPNEFPPYPKDSATEIDAGIDLSQLDDIELPCQDEGFFTLIKDSDPQVAEWTRQLLKQCPLDLTTNDVKRIVRVWGAAVQTFVEDARKQSGTDDRVLPGTPITLSRFLCIHDELEALYDELSDLALAPV